MRKKILLAYTILLLIGITLSTIFISELSGYFYRNEVENRLTTAGKLISYYISDHGEDTLNIDYNLLADEFSRVINAIITFIKYD